MTIGSRVKVLMNRSKNKVLHYGEFLGIDTLSGAMLIGVLETTIPGIELRPGKRFISIFHASPKNVRRST